MVQCGAPYGFWTYGARYVCIVWAHSEDERPDARTPYQRFHDVEGDSLELVPFGCEALFLLEPQEQEKFAPRSQKGVMIGFAQLRGFKILDFAAYARAKAAKKLKQKEAQDWMEKSQPLVPALL